MENQSRPARAERIARHFLTDTSCCGFCSILHPSQMKILDSRSNSPMTTAGQMQTSIANEKLSDNKRKVLDRILRGDLRNWTGLESVVSRRTDDQIATPPLSYAQKQFVLHEQSSPEVPPLYNESISIRMRGPLFAEAFEQSFRELVRRHEILRTSYPRQNGRLFQAIHDASEIPPLGTVDFSGLSSMERDLKLQQYTDDQAQQRFDLEGGPLFRASLIRLSPEEHIFFIVAHLSIVDGAAVYQLLPVELAAGYKSVLDGKPLTFSEMPLQFSDFSSWQRRWLETPEREELLSFWKKKLSNEIPTLNWPAHRDPACANPHRGVIRAFRFSPELSTAIRELSRQEGVTLFMVLLAGYLALLHFYAKQEEIIVGTPSPSGRRLPEMNTLFGHFINPVALRFDLTRIDTFQQLLRDVRDVFLEAVSHDAIPMEILEQEIPQPAQSRRIPFFSAGMSLQPPTPQLPFDWTVTSMDAQSGGVRWDLYTAFIDRPSGILGRVQYRSDLFDDSVIEDMWSDLGNVLAAASSDSQQRVSKLRPSVTHQN
jgi:hypothetical protein